MKFCYCILLLLTATTSFCQTATDQSKIAKVKEELQKLWTEIQDAAVKKDRNTLERIYAPEFIFIHSTGQEDNKQRRIDNTLSINDYSPAPLPSFDELYVYGEVAVLRGKGVARGTTIYVKRNGQWQVVQIQSTALPPERKSIKLDPGIVQPYVGKYEQAAGAFTLITLERDTLRAKGMNRPQVAILPLSETQFFVKDNLGEFTFYKDEKGQVTHYILKVGGREIKGTKVE
jgi:hypothetical protein